MIITYFLWEAYCKPSEENNNKLGININGNQCSKTANAFMLFIIILLTLWAMLVGTRLWYTAPTSLIGGEKYHNEYSQKVFSGVVGCTIGFIFGPIYLFYYFIFHAWMRMGCIPKGEGGECKFWPVCGERNSGICNSNTIDSIFGLY